MLLAHGQQEVSKAVAGDSYLRHQIDAASSAGYLVEVKSSSPNSVAWQKKLAIATPAGLAAGWAIGLQLGLGQHSKRHPAVFSGGVKCPGVPQCSAGPKTWLTLALLVLGISAVRRHRSTRNAGSAHAADPKVREVQWFRICTGASGAEPAPCERSETEMSMWSEAPERVLPPRALDGSFCMQAPADLSKDLTSSTRQSAGNMAHIELTKTREEQSDLSPRETGARAMTDGTSKLHKASSFDCLKLVGAPKDRIRDIARQLSQHA